MRIRKNAEQRKPEILRSFYETILEEGIEGASIGKVAKRIGIHPSLVMHYFTTKEQMLIELVDYIISEYRTLLDNIKIGSKDPHDRLRKLLETVWSDEWYRVTNISVDFSVLSTSFRHTEIHERLHTIYTCFKKFLSNEIQSFIVAGIIPDQDPKKTAEIIISIVEGYRHFKHFFIGQSSSETYRQDMKSAMLTLLHHGLAETQER
jgi:AcrR family transcriptional regulator